MWHIKGSGHQCRAGVQDSPGYHVKHPWAEGSLGKATLSEPQPRENAANKVVKSCSEPLGELCKCV